MIDELRQIDINILKSIVFSNNPRNIRNIAKNLENISERGVYSRIELLKEKYGLSLHALPNYRILGLTPVFVIIECSSKHYSKIMEFLTNIGYTIFTAKVRGKYDGFITLLSLPPYGISILDDELCKLKREKVINNFKLRVVENFSYNFLPYHLGRGSEISTENLDYRGGEVDYIDMVIIHELQKNGWISLKKISEKYNIKYSKIKYHYNEHVRIKMIKKYFITFRKLIHKPYFLFELEAEKYSLTSKPLDKIKSNILNIIEVQIPKIFQKYVMLNFYGTNDYAMISKIVNLESDVTKGICLASIIEYYNPIPIQLFRRIKWIEPRKISI